VSNVAILRNLRALHEGGARVCVRIPVIHGVNDDDESIVSIGAFLRSLPRIDSVHLLPFHISAAEKHERFDRAWRGSHAVEIPEARMAEIVTKLAGGSGLKTGIGG